MSLLHRTVRRWWPSHPHLPRLMDMALGPRQGNWKTAVAWRWRCLLYGRELVELADEAGLPEGTEWGFAAKSAPEEDDRPERSTYP